MSSGTPFRTSQTRAIPSAFATKTTPTIPPASHTYEPLVKAVLRHRLTSGIFIFSALFCWNVASIWSIWGKGGFNTLGVGGVLFNPLMPATLLYACSFWVVCSLPTVVLRKRYLTATSAVANSPSKMLHLAISKPTTINFLLAHLVSSIFIVVLHAFVSSNTRLALFVKSKKHPYYLNGRLLFLLFSQAFVAIAFSMRNIMLDRFAFRPATSSSARRPFTLLDIARTIIVASLLATIALPVSMISFVLARIVILPVLYKIPFAPFLLRPFTAHFLRSPWSMLLPLRYLPLIYRAWFLGATTFAIWEFSNMLFDLYVSQPINVGFATADPALTLISGVTSSDKIIKQFAYAELRDLATDDSSAASARRTALFGDQKFQPSLWNTLLKDGLVTLGQDYQLFLRRGAPAPPSPAAPAAPKPQEPLLPSTPKKLIQKPIYQSAKQSPIRNVIDSFAADGSFSQAVEEAHVPEVFRSVTNAVVEPAGAVAKQEVEKVREAGKSFLGHVKSKAQTGVSGVVVKYAPRWVNEIVDSWRAWWTKERLGKVAEGCLPNRELDVLIIEVLTHLTCTSLTEDRYGVVQRDIPKILEAMLSFLSEVEVYQKEVNAMYTPPPTDVRLSVKELDESEFVREQVERAGEVLSVVGDALKDGVARIVRTFGDKLLAFKFPPRTANKLQGFMDYC